MLLASACPICDRPEMRGRVCAECRDGLSPAPVLPVPPGLDACRSLTSYEGVGRALVTGLKFRNRRAVVPFVAAHLAEMLVADAVDVVTWAPTSRSHRRRRGFDQAEVLARRVAREAGLPLARCLVRLPGPAQTGRHRSERIGGPRFDVRRGIRGAVGGRRVALVDDVATTGATLTAAAEVLRAGGARAVIGVVVARTPAGPGRGAEAVGSRATQPNGDGGAR